MNSEGDPGVFATTRWSMVLRAGDEAGTGHAPALELLCRTYWYPLYAFIRREGHDPERARDLTQAFFERLLALGSLRQVGRERGRFRSFLLVSVRNFLADRHDHNNRLKRGGGQTIIELDALEAEERYRHEPVDRLDAARLFDRRWALTILDAAMARLETESSEKQELFQTLRPTLAGESAGGTSRDLAGRLGMSEEAVRTTISRMRKRYRELVREEINNTVSSPGEAEEEYQSLLAALRAG